MPKLMQSQNQPTVWPAAKRAQLRMVLALHGSILTTEALRPTQTTAMITEIILSDLSACSISVDSLARCPSTPRLAGIARLSAEKTCCQAGNSQNFAGWNKKNKKSQIRACKVGGGH